MGPAVRVPISSVIIKLCIVKGHGMNVTTPISKHNVSRLGFAFFNHMDLMRGADEVHTTGTTMIVGFQLMTCLNGGI